MRFLSVTETCDLGGLYMRLLAEGHDVRVSVSEPKARGTLAGLVAHTDDWRAELDWIRGAGADGVIVFEAVSEGLGALQDSLRRDGYNVVGGSAFGDRLENDRAFALGLLGELGLQIAKTHDFSDFDAAAEFIRRHPARYVLKFSGSAFASSDNYIGQLADGSDVLAMLNARATKWADDPARFVLMEHVDGIEMGVGAYFNGERFLLPACLDWEHKRFFAGGLGELTGEMGTVATYDRSARFFATTLKPMTSLLREHGHVGYVNLNTIVNERGIWPLEFTSRFGYPGYAVLQPLQRTAWGALLRGMTTRSLDRLDVTPGFSVGLVMTTPPFPYSRHEIDEPVGLPIFIPETLSDADRAHLHHGEVGLRDGQLVTSGVYGWTMVVTGTGSSVRSAQRAAYRRAARIVIPNVRYRLDIGDRLIGGEFDKLEHLALLDAE